MKAFAVLTLAMLTLGAQDIDAGGLDFSTLRQLPVLEGERYKPLDSLAMEWLERVTGSRKFRDQEPMLWFVHWRCAPDVARTQRFIRLTSSELSAHLGFEIGSAAESFRSFDELEANAKLRALLQEAHGLPESRQSALHTEALRLDARSSMFAAVAGLEGGWESVKDLGGWLPCAPPVEAPVPGAKYRWLSPAEVPSSGHKAASIDAFTAAVQALSKSFNDRNAAAFESASRELLNTAAALGYPRGTAGFPGAEAIDREVRLNAAKPFEHAVWWYFAAFLLALIALAVPRARWLLLLSAAPLVLATGYMVFGLHERTVLSGRALIGTFYESMLFVGSAGGLLGLIIELFLRRGWFLCAGSLVAFAGLFVATRNPDFMQPAISTLRPVLINNDWIHIHVPAIMTSYALLGLSFVLGQIWLVRYALGLGTTESQTQLSRAAWLAIPPGEVLLFTGIVLGGVWADASWGRFWGWDPKEVGALVMWLVFMVVVHGRWAGWLKDLGTALGTMAGGWALLWCYYGTNFFQSGQHSYAAANSSKEIPLWMWIFTAAELTLFVLVLLRQRRTPPTPQLP
jgi:ABC-type transport system involved in cytochrome c biogenesis permease subunit